MERHKHGGRKEKTQSSKRLAGKRMLDSQFAGSGKSVKLKLDCHEFDEGEGVTTGVKSSVEELSERGVGLMRDMLGWSIGDETDNNVPRPSFKPKNRFVVVIRSEKVETLVQFFGALLIKKRLEEKGFICDERLIFAASCYAAKVVALQLEGDAVEVRKQKTAFPSNFVNSLEGSYMMMTAITCRDAGLRFAGVRDSFWPHAFDVDMMNQILRQKFVDLYSLLILENLLESCQTSYPTLTFPLLPERGDFDLEKVIEFSYFFN